MTNGNITTTRRPSGPVRLTAVMTFVLALASLPAAAQIVPPAGTPPLSFGDDTTIVSGGLPRRTIAIDVDSDGNLDIVNLTASSDSIEARLATGPRTYAAPVTSPVGSVVANPCNARDMASADFDRDGNPDLVVSCVGFAPSIEILLGNGAGGFTNLPQTNPLLGAILPFGRHPTIVTGDFDSDGNPDIAFIDVGANLLVVATNSGTSGDLDPPVVIALTAQPQALVTADLNADGLDDLAVTYGNTLAVVFQNLGSPSGSPLLSLSNEAVTGFQTRGMTAADLDGNGSLDIATLEIAGATSCLEVFANAALVNGNPSDTASAGFPIPLAGTPISLEAGDLDGDGRVDLVASVLSPPRIAILRSLGSLAYAFEGPFSAATPVTGSTLADIVVADLDGDLHLDVLLGEHTASANPGQLSVLYNRPLAFTYPLSAPGCDAGTTTFSVPTLGSVLTATITGGNPGSFAFVKVTNVPAGPGSAGACSGGVFIVANATPPTFIGLTDAGGNVGPYALGFIPSDPTLAGIRMTGQGFVQNTGGGNTGLGYDVATAELFQIGF